MDKQTLINRIENLYSHATKEQDQERKQRLEILVRHYANKYHDVTGEWYIRDPAKNLYSKKVRRTLERIDVGNDYQI